MRMERKEGSIILAALFMAAIGGYLVTSYLKATLLERKLAEENYYTGSAKNLAEAGAETGVLALNTNDWTGWTLNGKEAVKKLPLVDVGNNQKGSIIVKVDDRFTDPFIISEGHIDLPRGKTLQEQIKVKTQPRALFPNAVTARDYVYFYRGSKNYNVIKIDSYDSAKGDYDPVLNRNRNDKGTVACKRMYTYSRTNAEIYGYMATKKGQPVSVGRKGRVYGPDTPYYVKLDQDRIATDFKATFADKTAPFKKRATKWKSNSTVTYSGSLNRGKPRLFRFSSDLKISSSQTLVIRNHVALILDDDFFLYGKVLVKNGGSLVIFLKDDFTIYSSGQIITKSKNPTDFILNSTTTRNGRARYYFLSKPMIFAAIYAPRAYIDMRGNNKNGTFTGAVVGDRVVIRGEYRLHFDEQLKNYGGESPTYTIEQWQSLKPQEMVTLIP